MKSTTRIALVTHGFPLGGITNVNLSIARRISQVAPEFAFFIFSDSPVSSPKQYPFPVFYVRNYRKAVKELEIDILVECSRFERGTRAMRRAGVKVVYADHGQAFGEQFAIMDRRKGADSVFSIKRLLWNLFLRRRYVGTDRPLRMAICRTRYAYMNTDAYVCLTSAYKEEIQCKLELPAGNRLHVIHNYQTPVEHPCLDKEKRIVYCGRLSRYDKRVDRLLRIWAQVQDQLPDYCLDIIGDGAHRPVLERLARELHLQRISFLGKRFDTDKLLQKASILCLTSQTEGWGLVLTEAQAHGVIPIAFNCSAGVEEVLADGAGILVPHADEHRFAQELVRLCQAEDLLPLRKRCLEKSRQYPEEANTNAWLALFRSLK